VTDAKARAIGVLVEAVELSTESMASRALVDQTIVDGLDAIAELLRPRPDPAHFYDYRV
jgi:hypothetical protein